jgi:hypothetical protein
MFFDLSSRPSHPNCSICDVPMWLVKVEVGDVADRQHFECMVCDKAERRTVPHEQQQQASA